jgi:hypothetical protein|tara:strand:+ start:1116 stop:1364 length:249 start_codon:yes stop_codon:yes gene_type:complete
MPKQPIEEAADMCDDLATNISNQIDNLESLIEIYNNSGRSDTTLYTRLYKTIEHLTGAVDIYEQDVAEFEMLQYINDGELLN